VIAYTKARRTALSETADIDGVLVTGFLGPAAVEIVVVRKTRKGIAEGKARASYARADSHMGATTSSRAESVRRPSKPRSTRSRALQEIVWGDCDEDADRTPGFLAETRGNRGTERMSRSSLRPA
jgi:hypothetical protein